MLTHCPLPRLRAVGGVWPTQVSERLPDGKRVTKRLQKLRPDLDQCPNGLAMADSTNLDKTREA